MRLYRFIAALPLLVAGKPGLEVFPEHFVLRTGERIHYTARLTAWFARCANDAQAYDEVVVPFLDHMIAKFPLAGYPANPPVPPLNDLLEGWSIEVRFSQRFERVYRRGDPDKTVVMEFQGV